MGYNKFMCSDICEPPFSFTLLKLSMLDYFLQNKVEVCNTSDAC